MLLFNCCQSQQVCCEHCRSQRHAADRDYAELSQLIPVPSESQWRRAPATGSVLSDRRPASRGPEPAPADGLLLGTSALNARYLANQQQVHL